MRLGIMQGRLSLPDNGFQECPINWSHEFTLLKNLGLSHVDWVVTKKSFSTNPVFSEDIAMYPVNTICADNLVDKKIIDSAYLLEHMGKLMDCARRNGIKAITIPLLEESDMSCDTTRQLFQQFIGKIGEENSDLNFSFEAELAAPAVLEMVKLHPNFFITYDTGNITSCGFNHEEYIETVGHKIDCVHLKDRTLSGKTVSPGEGDTDFRTIFQKLKEKKYDGPYTLQTAREQPGSELETIQKHAQYFKELYSL